MAAEALLEGQAEALTRKCIEMALAGDVTAMRLAMERVYPARKDRPVPFAMPPIATARDAADIAAAVAQAVAAGHLSPSEAAEIGKVIEIYVKAYQTAELNDRVERAEQMTDAELLRIWRGANTTPPLITIAPR
jgi:hypothetical protein